MSEFGSNDKNDSTEMKKAPASLQVLD